jgi:hypothetical protein
MSFCVLSRHSGFHLALRLDPHPGSGVAPMFSTLRRSAHCVHTLNVTWLSHPVLFNSRLYMTRPLTSGGSATSSGDLEDC